MRKWVLLFLTAFSLSSCSNYDSQVSRLETFVAWNKLGSSQDVWLIVRNAFGESEKVALIFGFMDDYEFCSEVAEMYGKRYPARRYMCSYAN